VLVVMFLPGGLASLVRIRRTRRARDLPRRPLPEAEGV